MFACIVEDATADNQNPYKSSRVGRSNQQATSSSEKRQQSSFEKYEEISGENRELKKRIKRMSLLVQETEGQRSTDRIIREQYAKDCDAKATAALMEKNTAHMIQLTQLRNVKDKEIDDLSFQLCQMRHEAGKVGGHLSSLSRQLEEATVEGASLRRSMLTQQKEHREELHTLTLQRNSVVDEQRTALLRRAMLAEQELKKCHATPIDAPEKVMLQTVGSSRVNEHRTRCDGDTVAEEGTSPCPKPAMAAARCVEETALLVEELQAVKLLLEDKEGELEQSQRSCRDGAVLHRDLARAYEENLQHSQELTSTVQSLERQVVALTAEVVSLELAKSAVVGGCDERVGRLREQLLQCEGERQQQQNVVDEVVASREEVEHAVNGILAENAHLKALLGRNLNLEPRPARSESAAKRPSPHISVAPPSPDNSLPDRSHLIRSYTPLQRPMHPHRQKGYAQEQEQEQERQVLSIIDLAEAPT